MKLTCLALALAFHTSAMAGTLTVTNTNDTGAGSLRAAIPAAANGDTIVFSNSTAGGATNFYDGALHTITLASALPNLAVNLTIAGPGPTGLAVTRSSAVGTPNFRVFTASNGMTAGPTVAISGLTVSNGAMVGNNVGDGGGGIYNQRGHLTLQNVEFSGNSAGTGGAVSSYGFGSPSSVTVDGCAFIGNSADLVGGAVSNVDGALDVTNSTFGSCSAQEGGAIYGGAADMSGTVSINLACCTFAHNNADTGSSVYITRGGGTGAALVLANNLFARDNSTTGATIANSGATVSSIGYNLSSDDGGGFLKGNADQINTDPRISVLKTAPGHPHFYAPMPGSPAIDRGKDGSRLGQDQRGLTRPYDYPALANASDASDIGAIEVQTPVGQQAGSTIVVTTENDYDDGVASPTSTTLREAIAAAYYVNVANNNAGATIVFSTSTANGATNFFSGPHAIILTSALPDIDCNTVINGPSAPLLFVQRSTAANTPAFRIFKISSGYGDGPTVTLSGMTVANGRDDRGGGVYNDHGNLTLSNMQLLGNEGGAYGGGVYNKRGAYGSSTTLLTILATQFQSNSADTGGAVNNEEYDEFGGNVSINVSGSTFSGNTARNLGGAIATYESPVTISGSTFNGNSAPSGGALYLVRSSMNITDSRLSANSATGYGGAIFCNGSSGNAQLGIAGSTLDGNSAQLGGGICNDGDPSNSEGVSVATLTNCTLSGNSAKYGGGTCNLGFYDNIEQSPTVGAVTTIGSCTFSGNSASGAGSAIYNWGQNFYNDPIDGPYGAGVYLNNTIIHLGSGTGATLVSQNPKSESPGSGSPNGSIISQGYNLSSDAGGGFLNGGGDQVNLDPKLGSLAFNGGPTPTHALLSGSPAINTGNTSLAVDQRGAARPQGVADDKGAYELNFSPVVRTATFATVAGSAKTITVAKLLSYASDTEGDTLTLASVSAASAHGGTVAIMGSNVVYTPATGYQGADSFTYNVRDSFGNVTVGTVNVVVTDPAAPPLKIVSIARTAQGILLTFVGVPNVEYVFQYRNEMTDAWQTLNPPGVVSASSTNGQFQYEDRPSPTLPKRFYRAAEAP